MPGRVITEATHMVKLAQALADEEDLVEGVLVAADWEKAFDRVNQEMLHASLKQQGESLIEIVQKLYKKTCFTVNIEGRKSETKRQRNVIRQGCPLSPYLFILCMDSMFQLIDEEVSKTNLISKGSRISHSNSTNSYTQTTLY